MTRIICLLLGLFIATASAAQNDFRSVQTGDWNQSSTWEEFIAGSFQPTSNTPDFTSGTITVQSTHVVTVTATVTIDQTSVNSNGSLVVNNGINLVIANGAGNDITVNGTLNLLGESFISGAGNLVSNGSVLLGSLNATGALVVGTTEGNVRVSGSRTYNSGSQVVYVGTAAQFIGSGHPYNSPGPTTEIDNSSGVTFNTTTSGNVVSTKLTIPGDLILTSGNLNVEGISGSRSLRLMAAVTPNSNFITFSGASTLLELFGTGDVINFPFPPGTQTLSQLTINRVGYNVSFSNSLAITTRISTSGNVSFNGAALVVRDLFLNVGTIDLNGNTALSSVNMDVGTVLAFEGKSVSISTDFTSSGLLSSDAGSSLTLTGGTPLTSPLQFTPGSSLNSFTLNKLTPGSATIDSPVTIVGSLTLSNGTLSITGSNLAMSSGATITKASTASIVTSSPSGGPWNLIYTGASQVTSLEIPASGVLNSLTLNTAISSTVTLSQAISVVGAISIPNNTRTLDCGSFDVSAQSLQNEGTFIAPSSGASTGFVIAGNLVNNRVFTHNNGTVTVSGPSTFSGTFITNTVFNHVVISNGGQLTIPTTFRVGGNITNNGTLTAGASTVLFVGTSSLLGSNINTTNFNNITINAGASVTAPATLNVLGNFANNGTFAANGGTLSMNGSVGTRTISGTTNTQFFSLLINKTSGGTVVTVTSAQTLTNTLTLQLGAFSVGGSNNLTLNSGTTIVRYGGSTISATPPGGPWNLIYRGSSLATGSEIPASGSLLSLTVDSDMSATVTLNTSVNVQNQITITNAGRTLLCGSRNVTANSISNNGTFGAPSNASVNGLILSGTGSFSNDGTFTHNSGLVTFSGITTLTGSSTTGFNLLTITGTLNASTNFSAAGNFINNGTFNAPTLVTFNGTALQNFSGSAPTTTFRGISVTNTMSPVSLSLQSNVNLVDSLTLGTNAKLDADGSSDVTVLTLLSTNDAPAVDAKISRIPAGAQVLGQVTVQRYFRPADNFDRFFSVPVTNATVAQLQASTPAGSFPITGSFTGSSFPCTGCTNNGHNFRYYQEANGGVINLGYKAFIIATSTTITPGVGYDAFMWNGVSNTVTSFRGPINSGSIVLGVQAPSSGSLGTTITHTNNGVPAADGWNLVGNPYPSPIQWNNGIGWTKSNIDPTVWVWDVVGRVWHSYNANTSTGDLTNGVITSGQGFWVYAPAVGAASISVNEQAKSFGVSGTGSYFRTASAGDAKGSNALRISLNKGGSTDNSFILIDPRASLGVDEGLDAPKLQLGIESVSISMISEGRNWGHMALGEELPEVLPLTMFAEDAGSASISFEVPNSNTALAGYYLVDTYLSNSVLVGSGKPYVFDIIAGDLSSQGERFLLSKYPLAEKAILSSLRLTTHPNPAVDILHIQVRTEQVSEMTLLDYAGRPVVRIKPVVEDGVSRASIDVSQQPTGLYILKVMAEGTLMTQKIVISH